MLQSLRSRRNRKGFTLAELLIVVAIIAVLVAIAVPLFVGALDTAEQRVFEANMRSLKGMAVTALLSGDKIEGDGEKWVAKGTIAVNGDVAITGWEKYTNQESTKWEEYKEAKPTESKPADVIVVVAKSDLTLYNGENSGT